MTTYLDALLPRALDVARGNLQGRVTHPDNSRYRGGKRLGVIDMVVWHCTAGDRLGDAWGWLNRALGRGEGRASYHYGIAKDGGIERVTPIDVVAYHAGVSSWPGRHPTTGSVNARSVGVAFANDNGSDANMADDELTFAQVCSGLWLAKALHYACPRVPVGLHLGHREVAPVRKTDPLPAILPMDLWRTASRHLVY